MEGFCAWIWSTTDEIAVVTPLAASTEHGFEFHAAYAVWTLADESTGTIAPVTPAALSVATSSRSVMICDSADDPKAAESLWVSTEEEGVGVARDRHRARRRRSRRQRAEIRDPVRARERGGPADDVRLQEVRLRAERSVVTRYLDYVITRGEWSGLYVLALCVGVVGDGLEDIAGRRCDGEVL